MTEIGEPVSPDVLLCAATAPGSLAVTVKERDSGEAVAGVTVSVSGPSSATSTTDKSGVARFSGLPPGGYFVRLTQDELEMGPTVVSASVTSATSVSLEVSVTRVMLTVVVKRIHAQGRLRAAFGDKSQLEYGHWWVEVDGSESYGWWPAAPVGIGGTLTGVPGSLNGQGEVFGGSPTVDPHHGDSANEAFHPRVESGQSAAEIKDAIRAFAAGYSGSWSWPWGQNCHSFQEQMMESCHLTQSGSKAAA